jgi:hypothetical protein
MKNIFVLALISSAFWGCKKDPQQDSNNQTDLINDPISFSKNIKVWHGVRTSGIAPTLTGSNAPVLQFPDSLNIRAVAGKYAIIKPTVLSGNIAGYYIAVNGATDYFKIDYTKPLITERRIINQEPFIQKPTGINGEDGSLDSAIVIILPVNVNTPDTFCIDYSPYDSLGNIGNITTICIIINPLIKDANTAWLEGNWRYIEKVLYGSPYKFYTYNKWTGDNIYFDGTLQYYCTTDNNGNSIVVNNSLFCNNGNCNLLNLQDSIFMHKQDLSFTNDGLWQHTISLDYKYLYDLNLSTCSNIIFNFSDLNATEVGVWSPTSGNKILLVYGFGDKAFSPVPYAVAEYEIKKINENEFWLIDFNSSPDTYIVLKRI